MSHALLEVLFFATVLLVLVRSVLPLIAIHAFGLRHSGTDFR